MLNSRSNGPLDAADLHLIAQRVVKLAEIATLEHLTSLLNSQADGLIALAGDLNASQTGTKKTNVTPQ